MENKSVGHKLTAILAHNHVLRPQWLFNLPIYQREEGCQYYHQVNAQLMNV